MLPGWQGIALADASVGRPPEWPLLLLFFVGAALMRAAGCAYNDIIDRHIDARVARTRNRPVASGRIKVPAAWAFVGACCALSLAILLSLNLLSVALGAGSLALVAIYPFMKRITWWPQAWLGLTFNWGALLGFAAASGGVPVLAWLRLALSAGWTIYAPGPLFGFIGLPALLLYASGVFWTLGYDTIYAVQDIEDDALAGVKSSARRLGKMAGTAVFAFYVAALVLAALVGLVTPLGWAFWPLLALYALALLIQPHRLRLNEPAKALALFRVNARAGLILFLAITVGFWRGGF
jgi:4-hydroxybenzoate polyprenyltransferase